jgi:dihydroorotate dehydrogenase
MPRCSRRCWGIGFGWSRWHADAAAAGGNPKPRLFRLAEDRAVINRLGFNNRGQAQAAARLARRRPARASSGSISGRTRTGPPGRRDRGLRGRRAGNGGHADYLTVNISSPNTPGSRALQDKGALAELLQAVVAERGPGGPPLFLKVAPTWSRRMWQDIAAGGDRAEDRRADRLEHDRHPAIAALAAPGRAGGLSGAPLRALALERLRDFRRATGGALPLIARRIASGADAWARIKAGASLVQLYSALVMKAPASPRASRPSSGA